MGCGSSNEALVFKLLSIGVIRCESLPDRFYVTDRQIEVIRLLVSGLSYQEIAQTLGITYKVVAWHVSSCRDRAGAVSTLALIGFMFSCGYLSFPGSRR